MLGLTSILMIIRKFLSLSKKELMSPKAGLISCGIIKPLEPPWKFLEISSIFINGVFINFPDYQRTISYTDGVKGENLHGGLAPHCLVIWPFFFMIGSYSVYFEALDYWSVYIAKCQSSQYRLAIIHFLRFFLDFRFLPSYGL
jgi:hypothetical protein